VSAEDILINITPQETRVAVLLAGVVQELHIERSATRGLVGNIYLGKVARVLPGMQSAFIDVGLERAAFLHVADIWEARQLPADRPPSIERLLRQGDAVLVQVIKDPIGTKGARLSTQISLAGRMLVYLPQDAHIGVSQRIEDEADRVHLRDTLTRLIPEGETGGFIVRTSAEDASEADLCADIEYLRKRWHQIRDASSKVPAETQLYQELSLGQRVLRDVVNDAIRIAGEGTAGIHVSFDLDVVDPEDAPGVGTALWGGVSYREAHLAMEILSERANVLSLDLVEVNPVLDTRNMTGILAVELAQSMLGKRIL